MYSTYHQIIINTPFLNNAQIPKYFRSIFNENCFKYMDTHKKRKKYIEKENKKQQQQPKRIKRKLDTYA